MANFLSHSCGKTYSQMHIMLFQTLQFKKILYFPSRNPFFNICIKSHTYINKNNSLDLALSTNIISVHHYFCSKMTSHSIQIR